MIKGSEIDAILELARRAGEEILDVYGTEFSVDVKEDRSPLTEADRRANGVIVDGLARLHRDIPVISEENKEIPFEVRRHWDRFWLVDPLDGTKEFVKRNGEFTVNIALVEQGAPAFGVVYQPVGGTAYWGGRGIGAWKQSADSTPVPLEGGPHYLQKDRVVVVASRSHLTEEVTQFVEALRADGKEVDFLSAGSSLKLCLVAEGAADVYPRLGPTMEWDTAAAHAVALEAGRRVLAFDTRDELRYNKESLLNPHFIVE